MCIRDSPNTQLLGLARVPAPKLAARGVVILSSLDPVDCERQLITEWAVGPFVLDLIWSGERLAWTSAEIRL